MPRTKLLYHLLALAVVAVWGVTFICTKILIQAGLDPAWIFGIRFSIAYLGMWVLIMMRSGGDLRLKSRNWRDEFIFLFLGMSGGSFYFLSENTALAFTQASNASFLVCSAPLITALLTLVYKRCRRDCFSDSLEDVRLGIPLVGGTLLALSGMALMLFDGARMQVSIKGDLLALGAALCWAIYSLFMGRMTQEYGAMFASRKVFGYGVLTILPFLYARPDGVSLSVLSQPVVWGNLLFLALVASLVCFVVWNLVLARLGHITSTNYVYLNPVFTLFFAVLLLGEKLTPAGILGSSMILGGVVLAGRQQGR